MKNALRVAGLSLLLLSLASTASAATIEIVSGSPTTPQAFTFMCDPQTTPYVSGGEYVPNTVPATTCYYTLPQTGVFKVLGIYKGTVGASTIVSTGFLATDASSLRILPVNFGSPAHGEQYFAATFSANFGGDIFAGEGYLQTGSNTAPADLEVLEWKWGEITSGDTAPLTVTADEQTMTYGSAIPTLSATLSGFVNGEDLGSSDVEGEAECTTTATVSSPVGDYPITCTEGSLSSDDYTFETYEDGVLHVTPATLTVDADDKTMLLSGSIPALTSTMSGFVNGETASVVSGSASCSTTTTGTTVGSFPITCSQGTLSSSNYTFAFTPGVLKVQYLWTGFLQPINDTAHQINTDVSVFKGGSTVPVKLQLKNASGAITTGPAPIWLAPQKGAPMSDVIDELYYSDPGTVGTSFALSGDHYKYNWSTKGLAAGYWWRVYVLLPDGTIRSVTIGLR